MNSSDALSLAVALFCAATIVGSFFYLNYRMGKIKEKHDKKRSST